MGRPSPRGSLRARGIAEVSLLPTSAAITNAIYDAVGVRINSLPIGALVFDVKVSR